MSDIVKPFFNAAMTGNSSMLCCLSESGEIIRLYWPHIDYDQRVETIKCGVFIDGLGMIWFDEGEHAKSISYVEDTNTVCTTYTLKGTGLEVIQHDCVYINADVMERRYEIKNIFSRQIEFSMAGYSNFISTNSALTGTLFNFDQDALIHYGHDSYFALLFNKYINKFQLGNNSYESAKHNDLKGLDNIAMMHDAAISTNKIALNSGESYNVSFYICAAREYGELLDAVKAIRDDSQNIMDKQSKLSGYEQTNTYWNKFISELKKTSFKNHTVENLYNRSALYFTLMWNKKTGGILASPEVDEEFKKCGRYAYCWGRDAAFITGALDICGLSSMVDKFYEWAVKVQNRDGSWHQRHSTDGNLAPSWGLQIDETGTLIWGMCEHFKVTGDLEFLSYCKESIKKAANFMILFIDQETGLPRPSFDLWEERYGEHTYSAASVCAGLTAAANAWEALGIKNKQSEDWLNASNKMKAAIIKNMWKPQEEYFSRSIKTKLNAWGSEYSNEKTTVLYNNKGNIKEVTLRDDTPDISILALCIPFGLLDVNDPRIIKTASWLENELSCNDVGGIMRYKNDNYMGGNPWIISTLWLALYHIEAVNIQKAVKYFEWALSKTTKAGLLSEQVDAHTGRPSWVYGLTWSHAMFIHTADKLGEYL